jgi:Putative restriction endonuclease
MVKPNPKPATYADIEALPPHVTGEILFGSLVTQPRPAHPHVNAASAMGYIIGPPFHFGSGGGPGGWVIYVESEIHLGPHVVVPDLAGWRRERFTDAPDAAFLTVPPDWVCEILSPGTNRRDRTDKMRIYAAYSVGHLWLLDPVERFLEVYQRQNMEWLRIGYFVDDDIVSAPPFEALSFRLSQILQSNSA